VVVEHTLDYAGRDVATAIEIGAGTGKATRAFASRGVLVTALEPDPEMFSVLARETRGMAVRPANTSFEAYDGPSADLVYAAAAMHWTDPATRWQRVHDLLSDDGVALVFGCAMDLVDPQVDRAVARARRPLPEEDGFDHDFDSGLEASGLFADVRHHRIPRETVMPQREYVGYLSTVSAYLLLPLEERQQVLHRVAEALGEQVRVDLTIGLTVGRRRP
jgi:SAM-dependent methyltransferase